MKKRMGIILVLAAAIIVMAVLILRLNSLSVNLKVRDRIGANNSVHADKDLEIKGLCAQMLQYQSSENPKVLAALQHFNAIIGFREEAGGLLEQIIRYRNVQDSVAANFVRCRKLVETFQPRLDSLRKFSFKEPIALTNVILLDKLTADHPELSVTQATPWSGDLIYLNVLTMRFNLNDLTLMLLHDLFVITNCAPYRDFGFEHDQQKDLLTVTYPAVMITGKPERVFIRLAGQSLDSIHRSEIPDTLETNGLLTITLGNHESFEVTPLQPAEQYVSYTGYGVWEFDITPLKKGTYTLFIKSGRGKSEPLKEEEYFLPVYPMVIEVR